MEILVLKKIIFEIFSGQASQLIEDHRQESMNLKIDQQRQYLIVREKGGGGREEERDGGGDGGRGREGERERCRGGRETQNVKKKKKSLTGLWDHSQGSRIYATGVTVG